MDYFCFEKIAYFNHPLLIDFDKYESNLAYCIGKSLSNYRKQTNSSQAFVAKLFGVSTGQYRKYEAGIDIPRMHSAARWSILSGVPLPVLFAYSLYADIFCAPQTNINLILIPLYNTISNASDHEFYSALNILFINESIKKPQEKISKFSYAEIISDLERNYYLRVSKNLEGIRNYLGTPKSEMAYLLGVSSNTYGKYVCNDNNISISLAFYARAHLVLGLNISWTSTGKSYYALFNQRRNERIEILKTIINTATAEDINKLNGLFVYLGDNILREIII
jgi:transcriptional regulator with XRE-family HTH domain